MGSDAPLTGGGLGGFCFFRSFIYVLGFLVLYLFDVPLIRQHAPRWSAQWQRIDNDALQNHSGRMRNLSSRVWGGWPQSEVLLTVIVLMLAVAVGCGDASRDQEDRLPDNPADLNRPPLSETDGITQQLSAAAESFQSGNLARAEALLQRVLVIEPDHFDANIMQVHLLAKRERFVDAADLSEELAKRHAKHADALDSQAAEYWNLAGRPQRAFELYQKVIERSPEFAMARRGLFLLLRSKGFSHLANQQARVLMGQSTVSFEELVGLIQPTFPGVSFPDKPDVSDRSLREQVGQLNIAAALQSRGDVREALVVLQAVDWESSLRMEVIGMKAWLFSRAQLWSELAELVTKLSEKERSMIEDFPTYWMALGGFAVHQRDASALGCFVRAIEREPNFPDAYDGAIQAIRMLDATQETTESSRTRGLLKAIEERRELVANTRFFVDKIGAGKDRDGRMVQELSKRLGQMGRPLESLAWQELTLAQRAPGSPQLKTVVDYKSKVLETFPSGQDLRVVRCGIRSSLLVTHTHLVDAMAALIGAGNLPPQTPGELHASSSREPLSGSQSKFTPPHFVDVASQVDLNGRYMNAANQIQRHFQIHQSLGTGVACLDFDLDGKVDFYFGQGGFEPPQGSSDVSCRLFRQTENRFVEITSAANATDFGYSHGITSGDWNQDGFADIVVGNLGRNQMLINCGDGTFVAADPQMLSSDWADGRFTTGVALADVTGDHLPDLVEVNYIDDPKMFSPNEIEGSNGKTLQVGPLYYTAAADRLFRSSGDGTASVMELGAASGKQGIRSTGLGLLVSDIDHQRPGNEIFVANDQLANHFWVRSSLGKEFNGRKLNGELHQSELLQSELAEAAVSAGLAYSSTGKPMACMGIAPADFNSDGRMDLHITNYIDEWSNLYLQNERGFFVDAAAKFSMDVPTNPNVGFGTQAIDYDNDGDADLVIGNGHTENFSDAGVAFQMPTQVLTRLRSGFSIADVEGGDPYWKTPHLGRSLVKCDWNRDGRVDFVLTDLLEKNRLFQNGCESGNHFLQVELVGTRCERDAIGARVTVRAGDKTRVSYAQTGDGYMGKNESVLCFGLGERGSVDSVTVHWPSGQTQRFNTLSADTRLLLVEGQSSPCDRWPRLPKESGR